MDDTTRKSAEQNRVEGAAKEIGGRIQSAFGELTDDRSEEVEGKKAQVKGRAQNKLGKAEQDVRDLDETL